VNGKRHRTDGPADEWADGSKFWYVNGKLHRTDGPAIEWADGVKSWYIDGVKLTEKRFKEKTALKEDTAKGEYDIKEDDKGTVRYYKPGTKELHRTDGPAIEWDDGSEEWYVNGKLHRTDGPAAEWADGTKVWYENGKRHRDDGPAIERADGSEEWYVNGKLHRTDGPAIDRADGTKFWYVNGVKMSEEQFIKKTAPSKEYTLAQLERLLGRKVKSIEWAE